MATDNYRKHTSRNPLQRWLLSRFNDALLAELEALRPGSVLDAGCGEGFTLARIQARGLSANLEGIDFNPEAVRLGRSLHPKLALREGSVYELPYPDNSFDVVICSEILEHLDDPERALREIRRVARKYALVSVPHEPFFQGANFLRGKNLSRWGNDIEHIQHWSSRGVRELVSRFFRVRAVRNPFPWTIVIGEKA